MKFPTLYKKTSTGAIQFWQIESDEYDGIGIISTFYGQLGTDSPQETNDYISDGKNIGKKNETSPGEQAEAEAKAKYEKQLKKGYVTSIEAAKAEELDKLIEGGITPMLAHKFADHCRKIVFPAYIQPKLDGIRCIAILEHGTCTLWSRTRKLITSMPHIQTELSEVFGNRPIVLDGELYNHEFKKDFEKIVSAVRKEKPEDGYLNVQYHIYDVVSEEPFYKRAEEYYNSLHCYEKAVARLKYIKRVGVDKVTNEGEILDAFKRFTSIGYEGVMVRNSDSKYVNKRSYDLLKVKEFDDDEFEIIGIDEGRGKLQGHVGSFICRTSDGKEFFTKMSGETDKLKEYFENHSLWKGKRLTVKYQGLTGKEQVPRFPVGISIRDYE